MESYYPGQSIGVSTNGSVFHEYQIELLKSLGVEKVLILYDYETDQKMIDKFEKNYKRSALHFETYVPNVEVMSRLINEKDSPIDKGKDIFEKILESVVEYKIKI